MPGLPKRKLGEKVDLEFTLRRVFGKDNFRYELDLDPFTLTKADT
jgi:hypothetical protein